MQRVIPDLTRTVKPGRVYLGVGPEQNFTYIAATKPAMAFIIDIRRGNLQLHLMYKALFELSADRAEFVSRLFSLKRPAGSRPQVDGPGDLHRLQRSQAAQRGALQDRTSAAISRICLKRATSDSPRMISRASRQLDETFYKRGLGIHYEVTPGSAGSFPTYAELMIATDERIGCRGAIWRRKRTSP